MDDKEVFNPQSGERIAPKKPKKFWKDWRFYVYTIIAVMLAIVSVSSMVTACAAINAGVGQSEPVSNEYKVPKGAAITTGAGGYTGYRFSVPSFGASMDVGKYYAASYNVDVSDYSLGVHRTVNGVALSGIDLPTIQYTINSLISSETPTASNRYRFLLVEGSFLDEYNTLRAFFYCSFLYSSSGSDDTNILPFLCTNRTFSKAWRLSSDATAVFTTSSDRYNDYIINKQTSDFIPYTTNQTDNPILEDNFIYVFQDIVSYYQEQGYSDGHADGYSAGETHAYETLQTGIAFETYGMYADAKITLVADRTVGSYYYMDLFDYVTDTNVERSVYVLYIQNASNSTWLGYVQDVNASDSSGATYDIGSFTGASSTTDVVFTALMDRNLWEGAYITSFHGHAEAVNNAFWFTGGSYAATQQIYQDGYGEGYDVGRNDGYDIGYDAGVEVGRAQGLNEAEPESLTNTLVAVFQQPFNQLYRFFNFNVLGLNVLGIVSGLISVLVVLKVFKKLYK